MELTKHAHACVVLTDAGGQVLIDPGTFTPNAAELIGAATAVLITHEHFDHVDEQALTAELERRDDLQVWGPEAVVARWATTFGDRVHAVRHGDTVEAGGLEVSVHGETHAVIHSDIPRVSNVGYLIGGVYHPGDAYHVPDAEVDTLLLPTSGPWTKLGEAVDYVRAVAPDRLIAIHDIMLSEVGRASTAMFLSPAMLSTVPLTVLAEGTSTEL